MFETWKVGKMLGKKLQFLNFMQFHLACGPDVLQTKTLE